jgi:hypothetical protein
VEAEQDHGQQHLLDRTDLKIGEGLGETCMYHSTCPHIPEIHGKGIETCSRQKTKEQRNPDVCTLKAYGL